MNAIKKTFGGDRDSASSQPTSPTSPTADTKHSSMTSPPASSGPAATSIPPSATGASKTAGVPTAPARDSVGAASGAASVGSHAHESRHSNDFDPKGATTTHSHTHLAHKTHETTHHHEIEEVERLKDHERHVTHVQHHVQPVKDSEHLAEVHHQRAIPQTHIEERHVSSDADKRAFAGLNTHTDTVSAAPKERTVVDLGERVNETVHHHVHNVIQPVIHKDTHEHHKIHTTIPTHHVTHEAPIVHQSVEHGMLDKAAFLKQGGVLGSGTTHDGANVLATGDCDRRVDGVGEDLARKLNLQGVHPGTTTGAAV